MAKHNKTNQVKAQAILPKPKIDKDSPSFLIKYQTHLTFLALALLSIFIFSYGFKNEFVEWDDQLYVRDNPLVNQPSWANFFKAFRSGVALNYHPLTIVSLQFNAAIWGFDKPMSFIITNTIIHGFNVGLVYVFIKKLMNHHHLIALFTALLFAVHPMKVESVTWVSERKDVLYAFFFLLSVIQYLIFVETKNRKNLIFSLLFFLCSCLSKGQAVVLPVVLVLIDFWYDKFSIEKIKEKWSFFATAFLFGSIALSIQAGGNFFGLTQSIGENKSALDLAVFSFKDKLIYAGYSFMMYIVNFFNPSNLGPFHPYLKFETAEGSRYYWGLPFVLATLGIVVFSLRKTKIIALGLGFYFVTIALVLQFISVGATIISDRYSYLPYIGLCLIIAYFLNKLIDYKPITKIPIFIIVFLITILWANMSINQIKIWKNSINLYTRMIENYPDDHRPYGTRGKMIGMAGNLDGGISDLEKCIALGGKEVGTRVDLGVAYGMKGMPDKAIEQFNFAINSGKATGEAYLNRGIAYFSTNPNQALQDLQQALKMLPDKTSEITGNIGTIQMNIGEIDNALKNLDLAINSGSKDPNIFVNRGKIRQNLGDKDGAITDYKTAVSLNPNMSNAQQLLLNLGAK